MTPGIVMEIGRQAIQAALMLAGPMLIAALAVGLIVSIFQAATSINEQTLSFLPRLLVTLLVIGLLGRWMVGRLMDFCVSIFERAATYIC